MQTFVVLIQRRIINQYDLFNTALKKKKLAILSFCITFAGTEISFN
jgi:transcriptional regulatory protein LevR